MGIKIIILDDTNRLQQKMDTKITVIFRSLIGEDCEDDSSLPEGL